ncbi:MAG TPA: long-chain fatty acid--CoA ligase [Acidimicrobiia bacterium]
MTVAVDGRATGATSAPHVSSLPARLLQNARTRGARVAIRQKRLGVWDEHTWTDVAARAARLASGLLELGAVAGDRIAVLSGNRVEWIVADLAIQGIGALTVGLYPDSPAGELRHALRDSGSFVMIVEDEEQLDKALELREQLPRLRKIIVIDTRGIREIDGESVLSLEEVEVLGEVRADDWPRRVAALDQSAPATVIYTSGTTALPRGAVLSHANLVAAADIANETLGVRAGDDLFSYLPFAFVTERLLSSCIAVSTGAIVNFGEGADTFGADLAELQPTVLLGVPRVWELLLGGARLREAGTRRLRRAMLRFWYRRGERLAARRRRGRVGLLGRCTGAVGWVLLYRSLRTKLGLRRIRVALSTAAPIAPSVLEYFESIDVSIRELYGQTEAAGVVSCTPAVDVRPGTTGLPFPGVDVRLADDSEVLVRSAAIFREYYRDEPATRAALTPDGWLRTGDVGTLDSDGFLTITGRKADRIRTASGTAVAPGLIERELNASPFVREAIVIGEGRPSLTVLVAIDPAAVGEWCRQHDVAVTTPSDLARRPEVRELLVAVVDDVNATLAPEVQLRRFEILPAELDHEGGLLTATQQVRRAAVSEQFADLIEGMYRP